MIIHDGYDNKPTHISIRAREIIPDVLVGAERMAELSIEQEGTVEWLLGSTLRNASDTEQYKDFEVVQDEKGNRFVRGEQITEYRGRETMAYVTLDELLNLRDECNRAIQELVG